MKIRTEIEVNCNLDIDFPQDDTDFDLSSAILMQLALKPDEIYFSYIKPVMHTAVPRLVNNIIITLLQNKNITPVAVMDILRSSDKFYVDVVNYCASPLTDEICLYLLEKAPLNYAMVSGMINGIGVSETILKLIIDTTKSNAIRANAKNRLNECLK